ncbi:hypothetical protein GQ457_13G013000 [Hibiscus cannabinus]
MDVSTAAGSTISSQGGRPPDHSIGIDNGAVFVDDAQRGPANPIQNRKDVPVVDTSMTYMGSVLEAVGEDARVIDSETVDVRVFQPGQEGSSPKPSFRDKLLGRSGASTESTAIPDLDVEVREEDVRIGEANGMPEIWFSNRVHDAIDAKLEKSMIIRLLDRAIGYRALRNRIMALWSPSGEINLIDLDNGYYLVRFAMEEDFNKVLKGGPWVIYGSYLTVQPWHQFFNTEEVHPSHIMVWVRLPKLPYRYYSKSLFQYIAATIGEVVRVDYNTEEGKRGRFARLAIVVDLSKPLVSGIMIDSRRQDIEYEGLPSICFKCGKYGHAKESCGALESAMARKETVVEQRDPKELYGPWMQVVNRRRRPSATTQLSDAIGGLSNLRAGMGSRFSVLSENQMLVEECVVLDREDANQAIDRPRSSQGGKEGAGLGFKKAAVASSSMVIHSEVRRSQGDMVTDVASSDAVVKEASILNGDKHTVVRVESMGEGRETRQSKGRVLPATIRGLANVGSKAQLGVKGVTKFSTKLHKRDDPGKSRLVLGGRLSALESELDRAAVGEERRRVQSRISGTGSTNQVEWQTNSIFQQSGGSDMQLLMKKQVPDIVVIMEPRVSGVRADRFIRKSGFEFSYRVEAHGFSGGIWLLWQASVHMQILAISNHPSAQRRRELWDQLLALNPGIGVPWVVGGDLNVISSSEERLGGSQRRSGICRRFNDFLFASGLMDMGYSGPKFTWRRGNLSQRLDRCLSNAEWVSIFPSSEIIHLPKIGSDHRPILLVTDCSSVGPVARPFRYLAAWNDHPAFHEFLSSVWGDESDYGGSVGRFQEQSIWSNKEVFGHIEKRKNKLLARIKGVDRALAVSYHQSLVEW